MGSARRGRLCGASRSFDSRMAAYQAARTLLARVGVADGDIPSLCASRLFLVPTLASPISALPADTATRGVEHQHSIDLLRLALARTRSAVASS